LKRQFPVVPVKRPDRRARLRLHRPRRQALRELEQEAPITRSANNGLQHVGTLTIDHIESEAPGNCRDVNFDPLVLPFGIAPSDDPLLSARSAAYSQSFTRRAGEKKEPSAVQTPDTGMGK
jgi:hypothetical protein